MTPTCYAQRLLNPFRGVMNIIEHEGAEAVTTDGLHWDIYVRDTTLVEDLADSHKVQTSDIRYGSWSQKQGLKRGRFIPRTISGCWSTVAPSSTNTCSPTTQTRRSRSAIALSSVSVGRRHRDYRSRARGSPAARQRPGERGQ